MRFNSSLYKLNCRYSLLEMWGWRRTPTCSVLIGQTVVIIVTPVLWAQAEPSNTAGLNTPTSHPGGHSRQQGAQGAASHQEEPRPIWTHKVSWRWSSNLLRLSFSCCKKAGWQVRAQQRCSQYKERWVDFSWFQCAAVQEWAGKPVEPVRGQCLCELDQTVQCL